MRLDMKPLPCFMAGVKEAVTEIFLALTLAMNPNIQTVLRASLLWKKDLCGWEMHLFFPNHYFI